MGTPIASISVTTYNRKELSEVALWSILANTPRDAYELIVVDNNSQDGTKELIREMHRDGHIDKYFINNWNKHLGVSTNQAFDMAHRDAKYLINFSNDHFVMPGWFEHFLSIADPLRLDFVYTVLRPGICNVEGRQIITAGKGQGLLPHPEVQIGGGLAIRHDTVKKHKIRFVEKWRGVTMGSIYSVFHAEAVHMGLRWIEQYKPCVLTQNCEFLNPKYASYYNKFFDGRKTRDRLERLRDRGGYLDKEQIHDYYEGSGYSYGGGARANANALRELCRRSNYIYRRTLASESQRVSSELYYSTPFRPEAISR
jgi:glycosyltransferase involved in cell wall biosynthesis